MKAKRVGGCVILLLTLAAFAQAAPAEPAVIGLWQYQEIVTTDEAAEDGAEGVLLGDLESMPLNLLDKVFGKLAYSVEFTDDFRFDIQIKVLGMRFTAQGNWGVQDGSMTLVYDAITGFEKLRWLGGFDHLTNCDAEHTLTETVPYTAADDTLTFYSNGANLVFARESMQ